MNIFEYLKSAFRIDGASAIMPWAMSSHPSDPSQSVIDVWTGGAQTISGVSVTELSSLQCSTVLKCVRILSETIASLPLFVYEEREDGGKDKAKGHHLYRLLHSQVNPMMTSFEWRETIVVHLALWGNSYSEIQRDGGGRPVAIWPLRPDRMRVEGKDLTLRYFYTRPDNIEKEMTAERVLHIKGLSANGWVGQSVIGMARESIGLAMGYQEFASRFFANDATPNGILEHPGRLGTEALANLKKDWAEKHEGLSNKHRMQILEEGMKYHTLTIPMKDAEFLESRKFQQRDIAGIFRIPVHMIGDLDRATFSNIENQSLEFVIHTIRPWLVRMEQAMDRDLLFEKEQEKFLIEFLVDGLLRGDIKSRYEAYEKAKLNGWMNSNEIRILENMNPFPGGDVYLQQMNMAPVGEAVPKAQEGDGRVSNGQAELTNGGVHGLPET